MFVRPGEHLLEDVLGVGRSEPVALARDGVHVACVAPHELLPGRVLAATTAYDHNRVGLRRERHQARKITRGRGTDPGGGKKPRWYGVLCPMPSAQTASIPTTIAPATAALAVTVHPAPGGRFAFSERAEPFRLRAAPPHVHGVAWRDSRPAATVVLVHGLQSHARWFAEAADCLVERGVSVYAVERRGSGSAAGVRGDIRRCEEWLDEVADVAKLARHEHPGLPVHLVGHCFGATLALVAILSGRVAVDGFIMLTPGLHILPRHHPLERLAIGAAVILTPRRRFRVPQRDEDFTHDEEVLAWIRTDPGGARTLTARALRQVNRLSRAARAGVKDLTVPLLVIEAAHDRIADNRRNRASLARALGMRRWTLASLDAEHLVLEGPARDAAIDLIVRWAVRGNRGVSPDATAAGAEA